MNELARIAAESVGSRSCRMVEKYQEGRCNKIFLMKTEEGKEVIAKVPQPNAGRPHFTTASEVATMDYVRFGYRVWYFGQCLTLFRYETFCRCQSRRSTRGTQKHQLTLSAPSTSSWKRRPALS